MAAYVAEHLDANSTKSKQEQLTELLVCTEMDRANFCKQQARIRELRWEADKRAANKERLEKQGEPQTVTHTEAESEDDGPIVDAVLVQPSDFGKKDEHKSEEKEWDPEGYPKEWDPKSPQLNETADQLKAMEIEEKARQESEKADEPPSLTSTLSAE